MTWRLALLALAAIAPSGCTGETTSAPDGGAPTIVSLNPCTDAILAEVTDPSQLLALSHYSHDPKATSMDLTMARRFAVTGGTVEEVLALDPDIVVGSTYMPVATRTALGRLGIRIEAVGVTNTVQDSRDQIKQLAEATGHPERGAALIQRIDTALANAASDTKPLTAVVWQQGGIVPGEGALISDLLRRTGFTSHSAARGLGQADYLPLEAMLADPPDVILTAGSGRAQQHAALSALGQTYRAEFDSSLLYCGGPTIAKAAERLAAIREDME
ncbi:ABC transporter substrate-binding protein [Altererythrobacter sp. ZODW24]|uniref:ABC transporter substrate-binding protein n=1 Tax=Altererythrobacter sp. ZODW24 TaxID=2185142 RepID=UPI000DF7B508|nr:ABC transporter substrate-binding protein [Altererythrobacter sp. ZODW24]